ncbi:hypothetical protein TNIN_423991 [Trichonephila inaurata madagascariensis]|uniref:Uncharacterized protein n=1 Tax=Trichonephila inaurata madagascariensis TaxID=2747483 RepID=A0A8X7CMI0_9ARAC|nr:hypothetical protein TNIN_423991 [Trichonephila inaurata madagascariensis]
MDSQFSYREENILQLSSLIKQRVDTRSTSLKKLLEVGTGTKVSKGHPLKKRKELKLKYSSYTKLPQTLYFLLVFQPTPKSFLIWLNTSRKRKLQMLLKPKDSKQSRQIPTTNLSKFIQMKPSSEFTLYF